jgi:teichoic acid transport system permease protein
MTENLPLKDYAEINGLTSASKVQSFSNYLKATWRRKDFIKELTNAQNTQKYSDSLLGRLWQLITPFLNAAIYFLIFGILLGTSKGIENYIGFLVAGVFVFNFMQVTVTAASASIPKNDRLIKAIHFPKSLLSVNRIFQDYSRRYLKLGYSHRVVSQNYSHVQET